MSSAEYTNPVRYDFEHLDTSSVQRISKEFGQYVSFNAYWNLLCEFSDYENSRQEEEDE